MSIIYHNLIILDRSGSMTDIRRQTVSGLNETLATIRSFARENPDTDQRVTLLAFCACRMQYIYNDKPIAEVTDLTLDQYEPCCCTPLYDAIGSACSRILGLTEGDHDAKVSVTILTDGYENASREWTHDSIARLIASLKQRGWLVAYIGADHDVEKVALSINITNHLCFDKTDEDTAEMFRKESRSRKKWMSRTKNLCCDNDMCSASNSYFDD